MIRNTTIGIGMALGLLGCGGRVAGDNGTESHWLRTCLDDSDCALGNCLCGRCTLECNRDTDCRWPLDVCVAPGEDPTLATCAAPPGGLCGISSAPEGTSRLSEALVIEREQCTGSRDVRWVLNPDADVSPQDPGGCGPHRLVAFANDEFVIAGMPRATDVSRVGLDGKLVATYTVDSTLVPGSALHFKEVIARADGRIALLGYPLGSDADSAPWIGILDADGKLASEQRLDTDLDTYCKLWLGLEPLPEGGYVFARRDMPLYSLVWSRLDEEGGELWRRIVAIEHHVDMLPGTMVVTGNQTIQMLLTSDQDNETYVVASDLDGNHVEHRHRGLSCGYREGAAALPNGFVACLDQRSFGELTIASLRPDGSVAWHKTYGTEDFGPYFEPRITYHAPFDELLLIGREVKEWGSDEPWEFRIVGLDVLGNRRWTYGSGLIGARSAPSAYSTFSAERGRVIALEEPLSDSTERGLSYYVIQPPTCP
ncbi:MAG: hypothetical protein JW940_11115 [Polyangiaceae bacterium]|nr:hypothetical protein [Polyangiaceae bacterium]